MIYFILAGFVLIGIAVVAILVLAFLPTKTVSDVEKRLKGPFEN